MAPLKLCILLFGLCPIDTEATAIRKLVIRGRGLVVLMVSLTDSSRMEITPSPSNVDK